MNWARIGAALLVLLGASYARAATPEEFLGEPLKEAGAEPIARGGAAIAPMAKKGAAGLAAGRRAARYGQALDGLQPEGRAARRGAKEAQIYQKAAPSVVLIVADDALGSGALITADGQILTNLHVVGDAKMVGVIFKPAVEGQSVKEAAVHPAKVIRRDQVADLALIQVAEVPPGRAPLALGALAGLQVGADVNAIGHPTGEAWTYTRGIVSQIRRDYEWQPKKEVPHKATVIQTQTPLNPGNSGGPLLDDNLRIVGINSFIGEGEGLNYAVSVEDVIAFLARKEDRMLDAAVVKAALCEPKDLDSWKSKKPKGKEFLVDADCDGKGDFTVIEPDDPDAPLTYFLDTDKDGKVDAVVLDEKRDGDFDVGYYDTDHDGKVDLEGYFRPGEDEPYRFEKVKK